MHRTPRRLSRRRSGRGGRHMRFPGTIIATAAGLLVAGAFTPSVAVAQAPAKPRVVQVSASPADRSAKGGSKAADSVKPAAEVLITRETYVYPGAGRRDPFVSLMDTEELRPLLADLKLVAVAFDPTGRNSVAVLRDMSTKEQYRVKVGQELGRMRVASIHEKNVVFGIEEFGYSRQESLAISDSTKVRTQ